MLSFKEIWMIAKLLNPQFQMMKTGAYAKYSEDNEVDIDNYKSLETVERDLYVKVAIKSTISQCC